MWESLKEDIEIAGRLLNNLVLGVVIFTLQLGWLCLLACHWWIILLCLIFYWPGLFLPYVVITDFFGWDFLEVWG